MLDSEGVVKMVLFSVTVYAIVPGFVGAGVGVGARIHLKPYFIFMGSRT